MNWGINIVILFLFLSACNKEKVVESEPLLLEDQTIKSDYLIEVEEFKTIANNPNIKILDFRKKEYYDQEHIEGALHIWRTDIEDASFPYGGIMASPKQIEALFSELGINSTDTLIVYDDQGLCEAARLWWILQNYDFNNVKLFHGGLNAWKKIDGNVSTDTPLVKETLFRLTDNPSMKYYTSKEDMQTAVNTNVIVLDTRSQDEFSGKMQKSGAAKPGRIPKSKHQDWAETINYHGDKKFKSLDELAAIYSQIDIKKEDTIIVYCHSGVRSAHTTFVLTQLLQYNNVKNYDGSWVEWSYFDELEFDKDSFND